MGAETVLHGANVDHSGLHSRSGGTIRPWASGKFAPVRTHGSWQPSAPIVPRAKLDSRTFHDTDNRLRDRRAPNADVNAQPTSCKLPVRPEWTVHGCAIGSCCIGHDGRRT